jgi:uncharacterized protein YxjI
MGTFGDDFWIRNERGEKIFYVSGSLYSFGDKLTLMNSSGQELAKIKQKLFTLFPTYRVFRNGKIAATLKKQVISFRPKFHLKFPLGERLTIKGSFIFHDYEIYRKEKVVARIHKRLGTFTDCYEVDVTSSEDVVIILCVAVCIDQIIDLKRKAQKKEEERRAA